MSPKFNLSVLHLSVALLSLLLINGCSSKIELNDRAFVSLLIVDKSNTDMELTLGFPLPNNLIPGEAGGSGGKSGKDFTFVTKKGSNISDAYRNIQTDLSRKVTFGQTRIVIIGSQLAQEGIEPLLEFLVRQPTLHINTNLFVIQGKGSDITQTPVIFERFISNILTAYIQNHNTIDTTIKDFLVSGYNGGDQLAPILTLTKQTSENQSSDIHTWMGTGGAAMFRQGKMVKQTLSQVELRGAMWLASNLKDTVVTIDSPSDGKKISFILQNIHTNIVPNANAEQEHVQVQIRSRGNAYVLTSDSNFSLEDPKHLKLLETHLNEDVSNRMKQAIAKSRKAEADVFHIGERIDWKYPVVWSKLKPQWRAIYSRDLQIDVQSDIQVSHTGASNDSIIKKFNITAGD